MNNLEETYRKYLVLKRKEEAEYLRQEKIAKTNLLERYKNKYSFPQSIDILGMD